MVDNVIVKKGVSGKSVIYDTSKVEFPTVADELALLSIGDWEPLRIKINYKQFQKEIKELESEYNKDNITDTVFAIVEREFKNYKDETAR